MEMKTLIPLYLEEMIRIRIKGLKAKVVIPKSIQLHCRKQQGEKPDIPSPPSASISSGIWISNAVEA